MPGEVRGNEVGEVLAATPWLRVEGRGLAARNPDLTASGRSDGCVLESFPGALTHNRI